MHQKQTNILDLILIVIALGLITSLFLKAIINLDTGYDAGWYHLPFAARIWSIIPKDSFSTEQSIEYRYQGFPLLAHFFQGLFWKITGRIQATNLVGYFSIIFYLFFLKRFFQIPLYISTIAIFAIPTVITHATTSFVDLPGNIGASIFIMMTYKFFCKPEFPNKKELVIAIIGAAIAANTKPQLIILVFLFWCINGIRFIWLYFSNKKHFLDLTIKYTLICLLLSSILIFATPIKNLILYKNPLYPIKVEVATVVLNHKLTPKTYSKGNRPQKWLRSILEINTPEWSTDQFNYSGNPQNLDRAGGFFGIYVIFNFLLLFINTILEYKYKIIHKTKSYNYAFFALCIIIFTAFFTANFPQSHELRYFMFWMITLVSFNLSIICFYTEKIYISKLKYFKLWYLIFFIIMCIKIDSYYLRPVFNSIPLPPKGYTSVTEYIKDAVKPELVASIMPKDRICLVSRHAIPNPEIIPQASIANAFFYSSYFHPELKYSYSIKAVTNKNNCGDLKKIP